MKKVDLNQAIASVNVNESRFSITLPNLKAGERLSAIATQP